jgi:hypothetical protein
VPWTGGLVCSDRRVPVGVRPLWLDIALRICSLPGAAGVSMNSTSNVLVTGSGESPQAATKRATSSRRAGLMGSAL